MLTPAALPPPVPALSQQAQVTASHNPFVAAQTHLQQIRWTAPRAAAAPQPVVAVLDTGVDRTSPGLRDAIAPGGRSFTPSGGDALVDGEGHGTHVAGIVAARPVGGSGVAGVSSARILSVKVADSTGQAGTSSLVRGVQYAVARRARIINISFGGGGYSAVEQEAIGRAVRSGAIVVVAAGNSGRAVREYPGSYRQVVTVAAVDAADRPLATSTRGPQVTLAAPGENILSTLPRNRFGQLSGTSMAAAVVSGAAARVWAARPQLRASQVVQILRSSARDVHAPGRDDATGAGVVDLAAALRMPVPLADSPEPNDEPREAARTRPLIAGQGDISASTAGIVGGWRDPRDGFRVPLRPGDTVRAQLVGPSGADLDLRLWRPGTPTLRRSRTFSRTWLAASSFGPGSVENLWFTVTRGGIHTLEVDAVRGEGPYRLQVSRRRGG